MSDPMRVAEPDLVPGEVGRGAVRQTSRIAQPLSLAAPLARLSLSPEGEREDQIPPSSSDSNVAFPPALVVSTDTCRSTQKRGR